MRSICRTVYGSALQAARYIGVNHLIPENACLNQYVGSLNKYGMTIASSGIQPRLVNPNIGAFTLLAYNETEDTPDMEVRYLAIGNMGHKNYTSADQSTPPYTGPVPHMARHAGLYGQIPYALLLPNNDLSAQERLKYRFRAWVSINNQLYIAYFLRKITDELALPSVEMKYVTVNNGVATEQTFVPTVNDLNNPTKPGNVGAPIPTTGDYLATTAPLTINLSAAEVQRLIQVAEILFGNPEQAIISEFAICHGLDKPAYHSWDGQTISTASTHPEAVGVQVSTFLTAYYALQYSNDGLTINLNLGAVEPLYGVTA